MRSALAADLRGGLIRCRCLLACSPDDPAGRCDWEQRAGVVAGYRERYGYADPADPIGPEPGRTTPEARAAWHAALAATRTAAGEDLHSCGDAELWLRRGGYARETAWAPPYVADELRLMRVAERDAHVRAVREEHEVAAATEPQIAVRHRVLAQSWQAMEAEAAEGAAVFAAAQEARRRWHEHAQPVLRDAIAADAELRRRRPHAAIPSLRPYAEADWLIDGQDTSASGIQTRNEMQDEPVRRDALRLSQAAAADVGSELVIQISENARLVQVLLDEMSSKLTADTDGGRSRVLALSRVSGRAREAVLHPLVLDLAPSARVVREYRAKADKAAGYEMERG